MQIRRAAQRDIPALRRLLLQVAAVHHAARQDLFRQNARKYDDAQLAQLLRDENRPVFVAEAEGSVCGYAFCVLQQLPADNVLTDIRTLYLDDLCVDEGQRGHHIGRALFDFVCGYARASGCYNLTLNVWACNERALRFYEACGLRAQKIGMETLL